MGSMKSKSKYVPVPSPLKSHSRQDWIAWRNCFLTYMNENYVPTYKQANEFFNYIGNIGLQISKYFYYKSPSQTNINVLLFKFDVYFIFGGRKRHNNESIDDYIQVLKIVAAKTAIKNTEKVIKEKVLQDLNLEQVFQKFVKIVPSFSKINDYESLALHELIFIWKECERSSDVHEYLIMLEATQRNTFKHINLKKYCLKCSKVHGYKNCKAVGQKCWKCDDLNHFARSCLKTYIKDCFYCGSNHIKGNCTAFTKECSTCKKVNHFSWKCFAEIRLSCIYCGTSHINNMQQCPARNNMCNKCYKLEHFSFKCLQKNKKK